jgi:16S rRNA C967 or C1407 C5-methylase (RsmB/RsmF family)
MSPRKWVQAAAATAVAFSILIVVALKHRRKQLITSGNAANRSAGRPKNPKREPAAVVQCRERFEALRLHLASFIGDEAAHRMLHRLREPPLVSTLRVNTATSSREEAVKALRAVLSTSQEGAADATVLEPYAHASLPDVLCVNGTGPHLLPACSKIIAVSQQCASAVLRGADVYCPGVLGCSIDLAAGDHVAVVCADPMVRGEISRGSKLTRQQIFSSLGGDGSPGPAAGGEWIHLGNGTSSVSRRDLFPLRTTNEVSHGLAVHLTQRRYIAPPLHGVLPHMLMLQNLPSIAAAHALDPQPGETILDMCSAPGGKATHVAALMVERAKAGGEPHPGLVFALDKSSRRLADVGVLATRLKLADVVRLVELDATKAEELLLLRQPEEPSSFDRVLLDPPCSTLGQRPRLAVKATRAEMQSCAAYQRRLIDAAIRVLRRPGGVLVYSTCTINPEENEEAVAYALRKYPGLVLEQAPEPQQLLGDPGWPGCGLSDAECALVQRWDPGRGSAGDNTIGFFVARMRYTMAHVPRHSAR